MKKVYVTNIVDGNHYLLRDELNNDYNVCIIFEDIKINIGDIIILDEKILKEINIYTFGSIVHHDLDKKDYIKVFSKGNEYLLERYYG